MSVVFPVYQALVQMSVNVLNKCFHCVYPQKCFWKEYSQLRSFNRISKREVEVWPKGTGAHWVCQSIRTKLWDQVKRAYIFKLFTSHLANCTLKYLCAIKVFFFFLALLYLPFFHCHLLLQGMRFVAVVYKTRDQIFHQFTFNWKLPSIIFTRFKYFGKSVHLSKWGPEKTIQW